MASKLLEEMFNPAEWNANSLDILSLLGSSTGVIAIRYLHPNLAMDNEMAAKLVIGFTAFGSTIGYIGQHYLRPSLERYLNRDNHNSQNLQ